MGSALRPDPRVTAMIPTIGMADEIRALLAVLDHDGIDVEVWDNGTPAHRRDELFPRPNVVTAHGMNLYRMWDSAVRGASTPYVAVLNDDLAMLPGTVSALADVLDAEPDVALVSPDYRRRIADGVDPNGAVRTRTHGTFADGGVCGWCFVVRRDVWPGIHPDFEWWCGDDDLVKRLEVAGHGIVRLDGWPIDHVGEASASKSEWTHPARQRDLDRYARIWAEDTAWLRSRGR